MDAATTKVENLAQGSSCKLKFVHDVTLQYVVKVENSAQATFMLSPVRYRTSRLHHQSYMAPDSIEIKFLIARFTREYWRGKYHCTVDLLFVWFGIRCMTTDNFCFYLQNRLIQTSQTGHPLVFPGLTLVQTTSGNTWRPRPRLPPWTTATADMILKR